MTHENEPPDLLWRMEQEYVRLLSEMSGGNVSGEGASGTQSMPVAEQLKLLSSAAEFLLLKQKLQPKDDRPAPSGIDSLVSGLRDDEPRGARGRRGSS